MSTNKVHPDFLNEDGVDHINIYDKGNTALGMFLSHSYRYSFIHPVLGKFNTMEALWYFVQSKDRDDKIRDLAGKAIKEYAKRMEVRKILNFKAIIMDSNRLRLMSNEGKVNEMKNSTLPFDIYYINNVTKEKIRPAYYKWILLGFEELRLALQEEREPNFSSLMDNMSSDIYDFIDESDVDVQLRKLLAR